MDWAPAPPLEEASDLDPLDLVDLDVLPLDSDRLGADDDDDDDFLSLSFLETFYLCPFWRISCDPLSCCLSCSSCLSYLFYRHHHHHCLCYWSCDGSCVLWTL